MTLPKPNKLINSLSPYTSLLRVRASAYEFRGTYFSPWHPVRHSQIFLNTTKFQSPYRILNKIPARFSGAKEESESKSGKEISSTTS